MIHAAILWYHILLELYSAGHRPPQSLPMRAAAAAVVAVTAADLHIHFYWNPDSSNHTDISNSDKVSHWLIYIYLLIRIDLYPWTWCFSTYLQSKDDVARLLEMSSYLDLQEQKLIQIPQAKSHAQMRPLSKVA